MSIYFTVDLIWGIEIAPISFEQADELVLDIPYSLYTSGNMMSGTHYKLFVYYKESHINLADRISLCSEDAYHINLSELKPFLENDDLTNQILQKGLIPIGNPAWHIVSFLN